MMCADKEDKVGIQDWWEKAPAGRKVSRNELFWWLALMFFIFHIELLQTAFGWAAGAFAAVIEAFQRLP